MKIVRFVYKDRIYDGILEGGYVTADMSLPAKGKVAVRDVRLLPPVNPSKIILVGLNYADHAEELGMERPLNPIIFLKPTTALIGPEDAIIYPEASCRVDYEAELAVVIKSIARKVKRSDAAEHILGYTCLNDVTARDIQKSDGQWTRAKSFDTFSPIGPWVETDLDPSDLKITASLNGEMKQSSRTSKFIFDIPYLIEFISGVMTLLPGDVISTGTTAGIGPMLPGDEITIDIEGIGKLTNHVRKG